MSFTITHMTGSMERDSQLDALPKLLSELTSSAKEHPDVALTHETGWCLSAMSNGTLVWENVEFDSKPRHLKAVPPAKILTLWKKLANGDLEAIESEPWQEGYF